MGGYEFPEVPQLESAVRAAHRALEDISMPDTYVPEAETQLVSEVLSQFPAMLENLERTVAGQIGPLVSWRGPDAREGLALVSAGVDLDVGECGFGGLELGESLLEGSAGSWRGCALDRVARAYSREAGWDFAPDETGVWLLMLAPVSAFGGEGEEPWNYTGHLIGFVIVQDRDEDGECESVAHIWTARAWRRRGIARRLLTEARTRFPISAVEGPNTQDGDALLAACPAPPPDTGTDDGAL